MWFNFFHRPPTSAELSVLVWCVILSLVLLGGLSVVVALVALWQGVSPELAHDVLVTGALWLGVGILGIIALRYR